MKMNPQRRPRHTSFFYTLLLVVSLLPVTGGLKPAFAQDGSITFSLFPISASGDYTIIGNQIFLKHNDQRIYLEYFISDWSPDLLAAFQIQIDSNSYFDGKMNSVLPAVVPCVENTECETILGSASRCVKPDDHFYWSGVDTCKAIFQTRGRDDEFVDVSGNISPFGIIGADGSSGLNFLYGMATFEDPPKKDFGNRYYFGTLVLDASTDAKGEYTIDIRLGNSSAKNSFGEGYPINYIPAVITVCPEIPVPPTGSCATVVAPDADPSEFLKSRYISFRPGNAGEQTAIRVEFTSLLSFDPPLEGVELPDFSAFDKSARWAGPPQTYPVSPGSTETFVASQLQCNPHFMDWGDIDLLNVYGGGILPSSTYRVQMFHQECTDFCNDPPSLIVKTSRWADVIEPFSPPITYADQPDINDVVVLVNKWLGTLLPHKTRTQFSPNVVNPANPISIDDVFLCVRSWLGAPYPLSGPESCNP